MFTAGRHRDARGRGADDAARRRRRFVGSGIFKSDDPAPRARAIVEAVTHFRDAKLLAQVSEGLGDPMVGIGLDELEDDERLAKRGW